MTPLDVIAKLLGIDTNAHPDLVLSRVMEAIVQLKDKAYRYDSVSK